MVVLWNSGFTVETDQIIEIVGDNQSLRKEIKMKVIEVIESKRWKNTKTGQTASIYGAVPYQGDQGPWIIETVGWTWRLDNGTVGLGRMPAKTRAEAEEIMRKVNSL